MSRSIHSGKLLPELIFTASRSTGAGGQNVNKVNSKVTLRWNVSTSQILNAQQKELLLKKLCKKLTSEGALLISAQSSRSQFQNKEAVLRKLDSLLLSAFKREKVRKATKPTRTSVQKRKETKRHRSEKKQWRKKI